MLAIDVIRQYYNSINEGTDTWKNLYSDDATFSDASKTLNAIGKEAVLKSFEPFLRGVNSVKIKRTIQQDSNICVIVGYIYKNSKGQTMNQDVAELWQVKGDHLSQLVIYFDLTAYRNFMKP